MCALLPSRDPHSGDELAPDCPGMSKVVAGGWLLPVSERMSLLAPPSSVDTPVPLLPSSGRFYVVHGPRPSCTRAAGRAGRPEEMANTLGGGLLEEVQRVEIRAKVPV